MWPEPALAQISFRRKAFDVREKSDRAEGERDKREKILVIDDVEQNRTVATRVLAPAGYSVITASSGLEGLEAFEAHAPSLVLLDVMMPEMDGFETCTLLRNLPGGQATPVVFLTALDDPDTHARALEVGAEDFLTKPIRRAELLIRVGSLLRLKRLGAELREQVELARRQHEELQKLQKQKEELTALIVHDLKSPLAVLRLNTQFALDSANVPPEVSESLHEMSDSIDTMRRLVMDLLDVSRAESGDLVLERSRVDLRSLVDRVATSLGRRIAERSQRLELHAEPAVVEGDRDLLRRVLENLVDNACKYTREGGVISIVTRKQAKSVKVEVIDDGPGIPADARERVFDKYVQLGERRHRSSRGLGLAFCKLAVEAHGGHIWVQENLPRGSRFCIELAAANA
jgi:signal transduction histidine kinase